MGPLDYLRGIKRRRRMIAVVVAATVGLALLSTLVYSVQSGRPLHVATAKIIQNAATPSTGSSGKSVGSQAQPQSPLTSIAALVALDDVTSRVAKDLSYKGPLNALSSKVSANVDHATGLLFITTKATDPTAAVHRADAFARELINYIRDRDTQANDAQAQELQSQMARVRGDIASFDRQLAPYHVAPAAQTAANKTSSSVTSSTTGSPADPLIAERNAALTQLGALSQQYQQTRSRVSDAEGLSVFQFAQPAGIVKPRLPLPRSLPFRIFLGLVLGLIGGIALSLIRDKFDRTIRSREVVEEAFGYPVLVEIPEMAVRHRAPNGPSLAELPPRVADGFRLLAASLNVDAPNTTTEAGITVSRNGKVIAVTSAGPGEGKTTVVANLAAALAEVGKTVLLISADFRHPRLHREFGASNEKGLAELVNASKDENQEDPVLNGCLWYTSLNGVWLLPSGNTGDSPDKLLASSSMRRALSEARGRADVVILDTSPVLTSDIAFLLPDVDAVLVVSKAGMTKPELAERSSEMLQRLGAPVAGVALITDAATALPQAYYRPRARVNRPRPTLSRGFIGARDAISEPAIAAADKLRRRTRR